MITVATVFKRKRTEIINGKRVKKQSQKWYTRLTDADGIKRTIPLFRDKVASQQKAAQLQTEMELAEAGVVDRFKEQRLKPLAEHLADFRQSLLDKAVTEKHAMLTYNRVESVLQGCKAVFVSDIEASRVQGYIAERRRAGLSIKSGNYYLVAIKGFFNWMVNERRIGENPLAHLKGQNARKDIRRRRRVLELDEIDALLTATLQGPKHHNLTAKERYMLYVLALNTGFRAGELHSLLWRSLDLNEFEPSVTILAGYSKNGREATPPLRKDVAGLFRQWFTEGGFALGDKVFAGFNKLKGAAMLRIDLEAAGIAYKDDAGRYVDFHSLRHTFITNVSKSGASDKERQTLARHSTSALTLDVYTHLGVHDERRAIEKLPKLHSPDDNCRAVALKTGTDDRPVRVTENGQEKLTPKLTPFLTPTPFSEDDQSATIGNQQDNCQEKDNSDNYISDKHLGKEHDRLATVGVGENEKGGGRIRTDDNGFAIRRLRPLGYAANFLY